MLKVEKPIFPLVRRPLPPTLGWKVVIDRRCPLPASLADRPTDHPLLSPPYNFACSFDGLRRREMQDAHKETLDGKGEGGNQ